MSSAAPKPPDGATPVGPSAPPTEGETATSPVGADTGGPLPPGFDERAGDGGRGISDFVRRAVSAGVGAASRSKDDIMRAAATEIRSWLERLNLQDEVAKLLTKMTVEVRTEIRFRPREESPGKNAPEAATEITVKTSK